MGNTPSKIPTLQILKITENSISHSSNILPFIHTILQINNKPVVDTSDGLEIMKLWEEGDLDFLIRDLRTSTNFHLVIPKKHEDIRLGISVKYLENVIDLFTIKILKIISDSAAQKCGLLMYDYILGIEGVSIVNESGLLKYIENKKKQGMNLLVFNEKMNFIRKVFFKVDQGLSLYGCEIGLGVLYSMPSDNRKINVEFDQEVIDQKVKEFKEKYKNEEASDDEKIVEVISTDKVEKNLSGIQDDRGTDLLETSKNEKEPNSNEKINDDEVEKKINEDENKIEDEVEKEANVKDINKDEVIEINKDEEKVSENNVSENDVEDINDNMRMTNDDEERYNGTLNSEKLEDEIENKVHESQKVNKDNEVKTISDILEINDDHGEKVIEVEKTINDKNIKKNEGKNNTEMDKQVFDEDYDDDKKLNKDVVKNSSEDIAKINDDDKPNKEKEKINGENEITGDKDKDLIDELKSKSLQISQNEDLVKNSYNNTLKKIDNSDQFLEDTIKKVEKSKNSEFEDLDNQTNKTRLSKSHFENNQTKQENKSETTKKESLEQTDLKSEYKSNQQKTFISDKKESNDEGIKDVINFDSNYQENKTESFEKEEVESRENTLFKNVKTGVQKEEVLNGFSNNDEINTFTNIKDLKNQNDNQNLSLLNEIGEENNMSIDQDISLKENKTISKEQIKTEADKNTFNESTVNFLDENDDDLNSLDEKQEKYFKSNSNFGKFSIDKDVQHNDSKDNVFTTEDQKINETDGHVKEEDFYNSIVSSEANEDSTKSFFNKNSRKSNYASSNFSKDSTDKSNFYTKSNNKEESKKVDNINELNKEAKLKSNDEISYLSSFEDGQTKNIDDIINNDNSFDVKNISYQSKDKVEDSNVDNLHNRNEMSSIQDKRLKSQDLNESIKGNLSTLKNNEGLSKDSLNFSHTNVSSFNDIDRSSNHNKPSEERLGSLNTNNDQFHEKTFGSDNERIDQSKMDDISSVYNGKNSGIIRKNDQDEIYKEDQTKKLSDKTIKDSQNNSGFNYCDSLEDRKLENISLNKSDTNKNDYNNTKETSKNYTTKSRDKIQTEFKDPTVENKKTQINKPKHESESFYEAYDKHNDISEIKNFNISENDKKSDKRDGFNDFHNISSNSLQDKSEENIQIHDKQNLTEKKLLSNSKILNDFTGDRTFKSDNKEDNNQILNQGENLESKINKSDELRTLFNEDEPMSDVTYNTFTKNSILQNPKQPDNSISSKHNTPKEEYAYDFGKNINNSNNTKQKTKEYIDVNKDINDIKNDSDVKNNIKEKFTSYQNSKNISKESNRFKNDIKTSISNLEIQKSSLNKSNIDNYITKNNNMQSNDNLTRTESNTEIFSDIPHDKERNSIIKNDSNKNNNEIEEIKNTSIRNKIEQEIPNNKSSIKQNISNYIKTQDVDINNAINAEKNNNQNEFVSQSDINDPNHVIQKKNSVKKQEKDFENNFDGSTHIFNKSEINQKSSTQLSKEIKLSENFKEVSNIEENEDLNKVSDIEKVKYVKENKEVEYFNDKINDVDNTNRSNEDFDIISPNTIQVKNQELNDSLIENYNLEKDYKDIDDPIKISEIIPNEHKFDNISNSYLNNNKIIENNKSVIIDLSDVDKNESENEDDEFFNALSSMKQADDISGIRDTSKVKKTQSVKEIIYDPVISSESDLKSVKESDTMINEYKTAFERKSLIDKFDINDKEENFKPGFVNEMINKISAGVSEIKNQEKDLPGNKTDIEDLKELKSKVLDFDIKKEDINLNIVENEDVLKILQEEKEEDFDLTDMNVHKSK